MKSFGIGGANDNYDWSNIEALSMKTILRQMRDLADRLSLLEARADLSDDKIIRLAKYRTNTRS